jgi:hypothetical protein
MSKEKNADIKWLLGVDEHDYPAAMSYLLLIYSQEKVLSFIDGLRSAEIVEFKAKDIFRASQLSLLGVSNAHVEKDVKKISKGVSLSPLLLVRDPQHGKVIIADGYHRLCAIYEFDEDAIIKCKIF